MARPRKYTPEALRRAVRRYFRSITRTSVMMESVATGQKDEEGHEIYVQQQYDILAEGVRKALDVEKIYEIMDQYEIR